MKLENESKIINQLVPMVVEQTPVVSVPTTSTPDC